MISVKTITSNTGASYAEVQLANGRIIHAKYAIVATGGMHVDENLSGLLTPRYSYLVGLPHPPSSSHGHTAGRGGRGEGMTAPDSSNFYTFGFSHDWCVENNFVRISGEDHYSGLKCPRAKERNANLDHGDITSILTLIVPRHIQNHMVYIPKLPTFYH